MPTITITNATLHITGTITITVDDPSPPALLLTEAGARLTTETGESLTTE